MVRAPFLDKTGLKKGAWSQEEDDKLRNYVMRYGHWNWRELPKFAGLSRCGKSCRLRWLNYLKPGVKRGGYSKEEEDLIIELHQRLGNRWSSIAAKLPGRTDNEVKNHWNTNLKRKLKEQYNSRSTDHQVTVMIDENINTEQEAESDLANISFTAPILESSESSSVLPEDQSSSNSSPECGNNYITASSSDIETILLQDLQGSGDFWTQPFVAEDNINSFNDHHQGQGYSLFCQDYWELDFLSDISTMLI